MMMPTWKLKLPMTSQLTSGTAISWLAADITENSAQTEKTAETPMARMVI